MVTDVYTSNLSFLICGHRLIFIPPSLMLACLLRPAKMSLGNRNEALLEANKSFCPMYVKNYLS